jgi:hypothetical protein
MKPFRAVIILALTLALVVVISPVQAQDAQGGVVDGGTISCQSYAGMMSFTRTLFGPGISGGSDGPFEEAVYTFTLEAVSGSATFRIVGNPSGSITLAGPFTTPATVSITMGPVASQPPGMGIYFDSISGGTVAKEAVISVSVSCGYAGCDAQVNIPPQAVVGRMLDNAPAYWEPGQLITNPPVVLEVGKTFWVAGQDASGMYRKVLISCQWVWVEINKIGPNYDEVWNGKPLPTTVVE